MLPDFAGIAVPYGYLTKDTKTETTALAGSKACTHYLEFKLKLSVSPAPPFFSDCRVEYFVQAQLLIDMLAKIPSVTVTRSTLFINSGPHGVSAELSAQVSVFTPTSNDGKFPVTPKDHGR